MDESRVTLQIYGDEYAANKKATDSRNLGDAKRRATVIMNEDFKRNIESQAVYQDSTSVGTVEVDNKKQWIIPLHHRFRNFWDVVILIALLYTCLVTPFEVSFLTPSLGVIFALNRITDITFILDMGVTCMTPILDEETGVWITTNRGIFQQYVKFWFWIDLVSCIPFDAISLVLEQSGESTGASLQGIRLVRLLRLLKLTRIVRVARVYQRRAAELEVTYATLTLIKFLVIIFFLCHFISCLFALIPQLNGDTYDYLTAEQIINGTRPYSWITVYFEDILGFSYPNYSIWSVYLAGFYYAAMTLTTIGYGDVVPKTDAERGVAIVIMLAGATFYAFVVGNICSIIQNMDRLRGEFQDDCDNFANFLDDKKFPLPIKRKLKRFIHFTWTKKKAIHNQSLLVHLSSSLQQEIAYELSKVWVEQFPFLSPAISPPESGEYDSYVHRLAVKFKPDAFPAAETLIEKGALLDKLYLIERGTVIVHFHPFEEKSEQLAKKDTHTWIRGSTGNTPDLRLNQGGTFGGEFIIDNYVSPFFVTCLTDIDALTLSREDFDEILADLPITRTNIRELAKRKHWEQFKYKIHLGGEVEASDPEDPGILAAGDEIMTLNKELKSLHDKYIRIVEEMTVKEELLKNVVNEEVNEES